MPAGERERRQALINRMNWSLALLTFNETGEARFWCFHSTAILQHKTRPRVFHDSKCETLPSEAAKLIFANKKVKGKPSQIFS
jgi:hypothetical protein